MRSFAPTLALVAVLIAISVLLAGFASSLALARGGAGLLDADLSSRINADYGDSPGAGLAPLDGRILQAVLHDESSLQALAGDIELVQVFRVNPAQGFVGDIGGGDSGDSQDSPSASATPTPAGGGSPGTPPPPGDSGPQPPGEVPLPTPTPGGGSTTPPTPTPNPGPGSTAVPTATPTPPPSTPNNLVFYLHNNPTPPTGNTTSQPVLPLNQNSPTASVLYNYDTDRDSQPGRVIQKGGSGPSETNPDKHQIWRSQPFASDVTFKSAIQVKLWSAMKDFAPNQRGTISVYLHDFNGATYTLIGTAGLDITNWQGGATGWVQRQFTLSNPAYTLQAGHSLDLRIVVKSSSADDMWFAYDTTAYPSQIIIDKN